MESKNINELNANPQNPRTISKQDFASLKKSITEFGDLSGVVLNVTTNQLVGGHQRVEAFKALGKDARVEIAQRLQTPTKAGTIAIGFVMLNGERYGYREVQWDLTRELAANIAANRISGQFDVDLLAEVTYQIQQENPDLLELTGQTEDEINKLMKQAGVLDDDDTNQDHEDDENKLRLKVTPEQKALIMQAIEHARITREIPSSDPETLNGSALYYIAEAYLSIAPALTPEQDPSNFTPTELPTV